MIINKIIASLVIMTFLSSNLFSQEKKSDLMMENHKEFAKVTHKMDIIPGIWRPMFGSEQVAWISPPWESEEYIWFDFPEAIWVEGKMIFLGHIDKRFPTLYPIERSAPWTIIENGIRYEQVLPNGVSFGGEIAKKGKNTAMLKLSITNGSSKELKQVQLLTCVYLNNIKEFDENTDDNKFIHIPNKGWISFTEAAKMEGISADFGFGWLSGAKKVSDLPVVVTKSKIEGHLLAVTWFENTHSFVGNPAHPCVHANPFYENLKPGESQSITGELEFFEGTIEEFEKMFRAKMEKNEK